MNKIKKNSLLEKLNSDEFNVTQNKGTEAPFSGKYLNNKQTGCYKCICCNGVRYFRCDINYPPILCIHTPNPFNKKYRLLDGKHRMEKMLAQHRFKSRFYVLEYTDIEQFLVQKT